MSDWKVVRAPTPMSVTRAVLAVGTCGLSELAATDNYTVQHRDTGETREVHAHSRDDLGEKISRGEFEE